jgi:hypothetical protein
MLAIFGAGAVAHRSCRALGRNDLNSGGVACGFGELPPSQREPVAGHEAVYDRPARANRHLRTDWIGLTGDTHHWDEEGYHPKSSVHWGLVGHRLAGDRIGSAPAVGAEVIGSDARHKLAVATTYQMEVDES